MCFLSIFKKKDILETVEIKEKRIEVSKQLITQKIWYKIMKYNNSFHKGENRPVENITYAETLKFCNLLSKKENLMPVYSEEYIKNWEEANNSNNLIVNLLNSSVNIKNSEGYRLPTEEEWLSFLGYTDFFEMEDISWNAKNSNNETHEVGQKNANEFGIFDMIGNVWEWCDCMIAKGHCYSDYLTNIDEIREAKIEKVKNSSKIGFRVVKNFKLKV